METIQLRRRKLVREMICGIDTLDGREVFTILRTNGQCPLTLSHGDTVWIYPEVRLAVTLTDDRKEGVISIADKIVAYVNPMTNEIFGITDYADDKAPHKPEIRNSVEVILDGLFATVAPALVGRFYYGEPDTDVDTVVTIQDDAPAYNVDITKGRDIYISPRCTSGIYDPKRDEKDQQIIKRLMNLACEIADLASMVTDNNPGDGKE